MSEEAEKKVALVFMGHPDDAEICCAGTVAQWVRDGWEVYYVMCTDGGGNGSRAATDVGPAARRVVVAEQAAEQRAAASVLGVRDVIFLDHVGGTLQPTLEFRREIVRLLRTYKPYRVITHSPVRNWTPQLFIMNHNPDHLATGEAVISAIYPASQNPWDFPDLLAEGLLPHKVKELYVTDAPSPNHSVDISATIDLKIEAMLAHASQYGGNADEVARRTRKLHARIGKQYGVAFAEEFHRALNL